MTHKQKVKLAQRMYRGSTTYFFNGLWRKKNLFANPLWNERRELIASNVFRRQKEAHERALLRKQHDTSTT
jgi:hypothetical protein